MELKTKTRITSQIRNPEFLEEVLRMKGGEQVLDCIQCGVCAGSCPVAWAVDYFPIQINKLVQLGMKDVILSSSAIWMCASCYACATRCPRGIDIPLLMSGLKNMAIKEKVPAKIEMKPKFHESFTEIIKSRGRMFEPDLFMKITKKTDLQALVHNALFGLRLWRKGKLKLLASEIKQKNQLLPIFENVTEEEK